MDKKEKPKCRYCGSFVKRRPAVFCSEQCGVSFKKRQTEINFYIDPSKFTRNTIKRCLISLRGYKCEECSLKIWNGLPIPLEVDHIDGDWSNNLPNNVRLLCPNCHAQTPTYKNKNKGRGRPNRTASVS